MNKIKVRSKSDSKRQLILTAATECFCDKGFLASSMAGIAKMANVSKQTVYSHFGSKDELFQAAIANRCEAFKLAISERTNIDDPKITLLEFAHEFVALLLSKEGMAIHRTCIAESKSNPEISRLFFAAGPEPVIKELSALLEGYRKNGTLDITDSHQAAIQFLAIVKGESVMRNEYNTELQLSQQQITEYLENTVSLFLRGYGYQ
ncbi:TetR/AcrR family transcriptional regulator [Thalassotalea crassostreae]|uniref:TetR/AcrR family transcriptional regulator n=1 Tax=Thalassotalea crassostreae TaxID=1763536 RepID=UPI000837CF74|nr:TetR/AcrR family transcriptional regulator [Thalassotalea crassostreae]